MQSGSRQSKQFLVVLVMYLLPFVIRAQSIDSIPLVRSFSVAYQNDLLSATFDTTTDYYYTGGSFIDFNFRWLQKSPVSKILLHLPNGNDQSFGMGYGHVAFTPTSILSDSILVGDRPFAGALYTGVNRVSCNLDKRLKLTSRLDIGLIGPYSFAYETQKFIHANTRNPEPRGWQFQIENDLYVNYSVKIEKGLISNKFIELIGFGATSLGTIYTNASAGIKLRAGMMQNYFEAPGYSKRFLLWGYANGECKVIGRDATLQGGLFNKNSMYSIAQDNINRSVFLLTIGAVAGYHKWRLEYFNTFLTREFSNGKTHIWGHLGIQYFF